MEVNERMNESSMAAYPDERIKSDLSDVRLTNVRVNVATLRHQKKGNSVGAKPAEAMPKNRHVGQQLV